MLNENPKFTVRSEPDIEMIQSSSVSVNRGLKVAAKRLLRNDKLVFFSKALKIAVDASMKEYDQIFRFLPAVLGDRAPVVMDVGANMGQFASRISNLFPEGQIYCFEPVPSNVQGLQRVRRWLRLKNIMIIEAALCEEEGTEAIHIPTISGYKETALAVLEGSKRTRGEVSYDVQTVRTTTIDAFVNQYQLERVDFIKVDTEGAEDRVVRGGRKAIIRWLPSLYLETHLQSPWLNSLYDMGYQPFYKDKRALHSPRLGEHQGDVLMIHSSRLGLVRGVLVT